MKKIFAIAIILSFVYVSAFAENIGVDISAPVYNVKGFLNSIYTSNSSTISISTCIVDVKFAP